MNRSNDPTKLRAHGVLDQVRAGVPVPAQLVCWALAVLGEPLQ
jgi:hypothetical protein